MCDGKCRCTGKLDLSKEEAAKDIYKSAWFDLKQKLEKLLDFYGNKKWAKKYGYKL